MGGASDNRCSYAFQCLFTLITNKEAHIISRKQLVGKLHLGSLKVVKIITTCHSTIKISLHQNTENVLPTHT